MKKNRIFLRPSAGHGDKHRGAEQGSTALTGFRLVMGLPPSHHPVVLDDHDGSYLKARRLGIPGIPHLFLKTPLKKRDKKKWGICHPRWEYPTNRFHTRDIVGRVLDPVHWEYLVSLAT